MTAFAKIWKAITKEKIYIQTHNFPDPDAISSAFGLQKLLEKKGIQATICYKGKIDRSSLEKMIEHLNIELVNLDDIKEMSKEDEVILVDSQKANGNVSEVSGTNIICIDHHPIFEKTEYRFSDIRPEIGACASIIASYYVEEKIEMEQNVATALLFGIKVDTANMTREVSNLDLDMFYRIYEKADAELTNQFGMNTLQFEDLRAYASAIDSIRIYDSISFADTGRECPEALIANISDFTLALSEVKFSVVYSWKKEGIKFSVRSALPFLDAGKITNEVLEYVGNGGGHASMAGGFVPYIEEESRSYRLLIAEIEERFFCVIDKYRKKLDVSSNE